MVKVIKPKINKKRKVNSEIKQAIQALVSKSSSGKQLNFGPVATVNTAPVAIGNSVRGSKTQVLQTSKGVVVSGRDFAYTPVGTGSVVTWTLSGGTPLTPAAFSDSSLRQYMQMYQKFRWRKLIAHYITSSPTSANGDVMFYHQKNRNSVFLSQTSSQLLPFVMSDSDTVIGPQWTNHSASLTMSNSWKSTDYGMSSVVDDFSDGDLFLLSKTSTTDSPGYVIIDFIVEFCELQISPRLLSLPLPRAQWFQSHFGKTGALLSAGSQVCMELYGSGISGSSATLPTGASNGDIYKVILDVTNSTAPLLNLRVNEANSTSVAFSIVDGTTLYGIYNGASLCLYPDVESAFTNGTPVAYTAGGTFTYDFQVWMSLVGTVSATNFNPNF